MEMAKEELIQFVQELLSGARTGEIQISTNWRSFDEDRFRNSVTVKFFDNGEETGTLTISV